MKDIAGFLQKIGLGGRRNAVGELDDLETGPARSERESAAKPRAKLSASSSSLIKALVGSASYVEDPYFPPELVGGTCPRIVGQEEEIVWNAAAESCDSERVHVVWQSFENRIWYLAVRSAELASHPQSWCPFASLLPTMKDAGTIPVCYAHFGEEAAVLMIVTADGLQIFRGTSPVVRAKAERTARELGNAPIITLDPDRMEKLTPVPWYSLSLFEDRARRALATYSVLVATGLTVFSFVVWLSANMASLSAHHDLSGAREHTQAKSLQMMRDVQNTRTSPLRDQVEKFLSVNDGLLALNGFLNVYEVKAGVTRWRALVPPSATADKISAIGGKSIEATDKGVAIGNDAEIEFEQSGAKH